jgi:hypothetical protein
MSDNNLGKLFRNIPKLNGKENFVEWDQPLRLTLPIVKGSQFIVHVPPAESVSSRKASIRRLI